MYEGVPKVWILRQLFITVFTANVQIDGLGLHICVYAEYKNIERFVNMSELMLHIVGIISSSSATIVLA